MQSMSINHLSLLIYLKNFTFQRIIFATYPLYFLYDIYNHFYLWIN